MCVAVAPSRDSPAWSRPWAPLLRAERNPLLYPARMQGGHVISHGAAIHNDQSYVPPVGEQVALRWPLSTPGKRQSKCTPQLACPSWAGQGP